MDPQNFESEPTATPAARPEALRDRVIDAIKTCYDPEIPVNTWERGLIYDASVADPGSVAIRVTLTSPACPVAGSLPPAAGEEVRSVEGVTEATVEVVWEPSWTPALMGEAAKLELNMM